MKLTLRTKHDIELSADEVLEVLGKSMRFSEFLKSKGMDTEINFKFEK